MASESGRGQTAILWYCGVADRREVIQDFSGMSGRKAETKERKSRVREKVEYNIRHQSTTRHEEPCGKPGGPPPKPKYSSVTDSEAVL